MNERINEQNLQLTKPWSEIISTYMTSRIYSTGMVMFWCGWCKAFFLSQSDETVPLGRGLLWSASCFDADLGCRLSRATQQGWWYDVLSRPSGGQWVFLLTQIHGTTAHVIRYTMEKWCLLTAGAVVWLEVRSIHHCPTGKADGPAVDPAVSKDLK